MGSRMDVFSKELEVEKMKKKKKQPNYQAFFAVGVIFMGVGVTFMAAVNPGLGAAFIGLGAVYMIIGGKNKDKWGK